MTIEFTDEQHRHLLIALLLARDAIEDMAPWEIDDEAERARDLVVNETLYRQLEVMHGTH
jgi:hypothetical protein